MATTIFISSYCCTNGKVLVKTGNTGVLISAQMRGNVLTEGDYGKQRWANIKIMLCLSVCTGHTAQATLAQGGRTAPVQRRIHPVTMPAPEGTTRLQ